MEMQVQRDDLSSIHQSTSWELFQGNSGQRCACWNWLQQPLLISH